MTLMSKAAELVLFGSVLYSGYQLLPGITHAPASIDAIVFVIQQAALDIGGMGLLKLAKRAGLPQHSFPVRVGITLVILMILNVVLASLKQAIPAIPATVFVWVETVLLIARAIMAVLFGHAIHALREEYSESTITVKEASELREDMEGLASELAQARLHVQQQLAQGVQEQMTERGHLLNHFTSELQGVQSQVHLHVQREIQQAIEQVHIQSHEVQSSQVQRILEQLPALIQEQVKQALGHQGLHPVQQAESAMHRHRHPTSAVHSAAEDTPLHPGAAPLLGATDNAKRPHPRDEQGKGAQVQQFVREQQAQGHIPTLDEIMQACQCSKHTAIQHRRAVLDHGQQAGVQPKLTMIRAAGE